MSNLLEKVAFHIAENIEEVKLIPNKNLFINNYPDTPDTIVSIIDNGGHPPSLYVPTREKVVEIKFRVSNYKEGNALGEEIFKLFHSEENFYLDGLRVLHSYARTEVNYLYKDSNEREEFVLELVFLIQK